MLGLSHLHKLFCNNRAVIKILNACSKCCLFLNAPANGAVCTASYLSDN